MVMAIHRPGSRTPSPNPSTPPSLLQKARFYAILSLVTLAVQNTSLALVLHASRIAPPEDGQGQQHDRGAYFTPAAVLCTEVAKTIICATLLLVGIAKAKARQQLASQQKHQHTITTLLDSISFSTIRKACTLVFSDSAWPLSFPAILYVLQNNLQYTAAENLEPAVFQTLYQLKILTTALFSRILLGKRLHRKQWIALLVLATGVAIVQVGSSGGGPHHGPHDPPPFPPPPPPPHPPHLPPSAQSHTGLQEEYASLMAEEMANIERREGWWPHGPPPPPGPPPPGPPPPPMPYNAASPLVGFLAVLAACVTSGLAGVWFEKVVKGGCSPPSTQTAKQAQTTPRTEDNMSASSLAALASSLSRSRSPLSTQHKGVDDEEEDEEDVRASSSSRSGDANKQSDTLDLSSCTVWLSALQLSLFSLAPALVPVLVKMYADSPESGATPDLHAPFRNFGTWAWSIVALQTVGGLVTALVVRWADNILKCFAVALALLMTSVLSIPMFDFVLTPSFVVGAGLTLCATVMYQRGGHCEQTKTRSREADEEGVLFDVDAKDDEEAIALLPSREVRK